MKLFSELTETPTNAIIFLDIDGTLCGEGETSPTPAALRALQRIAKKNEIHLCSNGKNLKRNRKMGKHCSVPYLDTRLQKPDKAIAALVTNKKKKSLVVIGNLYYTDGRFAKNIGGHFIKVKTLLAPNEPWPNRIFYWLDENIIAHFV
jgi:predicted HAD superfamily phosphohydrolase YqeG